MAVRFKCLSEYQRSFRVSPQRGAPLAGLSSAHMGLSREPGLQRRRRLGPGGLGPGGLGPGGLGPGGLGPGGLGPPAGPGPPPDSGPPAGPGPPPDSGPPAGPGPPPDSGPPAGPGPPPDSGPPAGPGPAADPRPSSAKPRPFKLDSQPQLSRPSTADGRQLSANEVQRILRWRAGLKVGGQRSGGQRSEYHRQFSWKKPATAASPILTAEQLLHSSGRCVRPFKKHAVPMETEYQRSFQGLAPPPEPRLRKHLEHHQRAPLFHMHRANKNRREGSEKKPRPTQDCPAPKNDSARIPEGGGATDGDAHQVEARRRDASWYRRRAWGCNFDREHLSQLLSHHSSPDPASPRLTSDLPTSPLEALDLASRSRETTPTPPGPPGEGGGGGGGEEEEEEEEEEDTDEEEGRLPTPRLKIRPVQRTHHDLTTPATGGALLVGKLKSSEDKQRCRSAVSDRPVYRKEAWSENSPSHRPPSSSSGSSPNHKAAVGPAFKPMRTKPTYLVAPPPVAPPPQHCIQGMLRKADFQHNGDLGVRFRDLPCPGGCCSDEGDRLSAMSWRSAASCSAASAVLERAQRRREHFWGRDDL